MRKLHLLIVITGLVMMIAGIILQKGGAVVIGLIVSAVNLGFLLPFRKQGE